MNEICRFDLLSEGNVIATKSYKLGACLGKGTFGSVFEVLLLEDDSVHAMKALHRENWHSLSANEQYKMSRLVGLNHDNVVRTHYIGRSIKPGFGVLIFQDYCEGGTLLSLLVQDRLLTLEEIRQYTRQLLEGLKYLHTVDVIHTDLKSENVFLTADKMVVKIGDIDDHVYMAAGTTMDADIVKPRGTYSFMSPEMVNLRTNSVFTGTSLSHRTPVGRKTDIWSLGCVVLDMATKATFKLVATNGTKGECAAYGAKVEFVLSLMISSRARPEIPEYVTDIYLKQFLEACFAENPDARPSAEVALDIYRFLTASGITNTKPHEGGNEQESIITHLKSSVGFEEIQDQPEEYFHAKLAARLLVHFRFDFPVGNYHQEKLTCPCAIRPNQNLSDGHRDILLRNLQGSLLTKFCRRSEQKIQLNDVLSGDFSSLIQLLMSFDAVRLQNGTIILGTGESQVSIDLSWVALLTVGALFFGNKSLQNQATQFFPMLPGDPIGISRWMNRYCNGSRQFFAKQGAVWEDIKQCLDKHEPVIALLQIAHVEMPEAVIMAASSLGLEAPDRTPWLRYRIILGYQLGIQGQGKQSFIETVFYTDTETNFAVNRMPYPQFMTQWEWKVKNPVLREIFQQSKFYSSTFIALNR